jgi:hypothetical protein
MKNPTALIWLSCCISILFPLGLSLTAYRLQVMLSHRRPKLEYRKSKEDNILVRTWRLEIYDREPLTREDKDD